MRKFGWKQIIWMALFISLILSFSGINLRMTNESANKSVVTTIDYGEFEKAAHYADADINEVLQQLKEQGVHAVTFRELTLRDLAYRGDIHLSSFAQFRSQMQTFSPQEWETIKKQLAGKNIAPVNQIAVTDDPRTARFLNERLTARFTPEELISFESGDKSYFIINTELVELFKTDDKAKTRNIDSRLGFDTEALNRVKKAGFEIVLSPGNIIGSAAGYLDEYQQVVKEYGVNYIFFLSSELPGYPLHQEVMKQLVEENNLIVGIVETPFQLGYNPAKGLDELMEATDYPINRVYSTRNDEFLKDTNERYYRWVRAVVDRGLRILYVVPFGDSKLTYSQNLDETLEKIGMFQDTIASKGFSIDQPINRLSSETPGNFHRFMVSLSLLLAGTLYLGYLFRLSRPFIVGLLGIGILGLAGVNLMLKLDLTQLWALGAAIIYPSLSSLLLLLYLKGHRQQPVGLQIIASLAILLGVNLLGAYTVVTSLADIRYIMNVELFRGVKLAFVLPLMLFVVNYLACFVGPENIKTCLEKYLKLSPSYLVLGILFVGAVAFYIYVARSGHTSGITVSAWELKLREFLEMVFLARPRFKEIIIGYPALFAMIYLYHKYKQDLILLVLGLGVVMGSISMINSFSHVFTAVVISAHRTLAGLAVGVVTGILTLAAIYIAEKIYTRWS